jgi:hypothetical protein
MIQPLTQKKHQSLSLPFVSHLVHLAHVDAHSGTSIEPSSKFECGDMGIIKAPEPLSGLLQALLFSELLRQGPARQSHSHPNQGPPPRTSLPASPCGPPPLPSPFMNCTQPVRFSPTPFDPSSKTQNPFSHWDQNPQASQWSSRDLPLPSQSAVGRFDPSIPFAHTAPGNQAGTANVPPPEKLYVPAADLVPSNQAPARPLVSAQAMAPPAYGDSLFENRIPKANGSTNGKTAQAPKPLHVASAGARRTSLQGGAPGMAAAVLSASEANVLNSGAAKGGAESMSGRAKDQGAVQTANQGEASRTPVPDAKARPQKARKGGGPKVRSGFVADTLQKDVVAFLAALLQKALSGFQPLISWKSQASFATWPVQHSKLFLCSSFGQTFFAAEIHLKPGKQTISKGQCGLCGKVPCLPLNWKDQPRMFRYRLARGHLQQRPEISQQRLLWRRSSRKRLLALPTGLLAKLGRRPSRTCASGRRGRSGSMLPVG